MTPFRRLLLAVAAIAAVVLAYDLFQGRIESFHPGVTLAVDPGSGALTVEAPQERVRIVFASMFGPGEPVMRVRGKWIRRFEREYGARLSAGRGLALGAADRRRALDEARRQARRVAPALRRRLAADEPRGTLDWLAERGVAVAAAAGDEAAALPRVAEALERFAAGAATNVDAVARVQVGVECRWQGRWVLSANRPRFLTGREVPDIIEGSKFELLALVQDGYAVPMDLPLPGDALSPLDQPDTWGRPERPWRDAFIPAMLAEGRYETADPAARERVFLVPLTCFTYCIFYNEKLFLKAGIAKPPRTWPEFLDVCARLKAAGVTPLTADMENYSDAWMMWLIYRALGPEAWERTVTGVERPGGGPRVSDPPWTDPRYRAAFAQIRLLRERGYFDPSFAGSLWPAAQRAFASGSAAMMINGSWLVQELAGYRDEAGAAGFALGCFSFPQWPGGRPADQAASYAGASGLMVCRQGGATRHAVELVKYLSARDHGDMVHANAQISCLRDADFPPALAGVAEDFRRAPAAYSRTPQTFARRYNAAVLTPLYTEFFMAETASADDFVKRLAERTDEYLRRGGEEGFE